MTTDISTLIVTRLLSMGFFNILIFVLSMTVLYAILRNKKLLGDNPLINAIVAFSVAFFVFAFPIISGINLVAPLSSFITQAFVMGIVFFLGILLASIFYPNILGFLEKAFQSRNILFGMIALALALFVTSGLISVIFFSPQTGPQAQPSNRGTDISLLVAGLIIVFVILLIASHISRGA